VRNASSQPLANIAVSWTVTQGGGSLGAATSNTSAQGQASNTYIVGGSAGPQGVMAAVQADATLSVEFGGTANAVSATAGVTVGDDFFDPTNAVVAEGGQVTWTWAGASTHNVTSVSGAFANSGDKASGTHPVTFSTTGVYDYYCSIHGAPGVGMRGTVTVQ
jgi:plastocyanin